MSKRTTTNKKAVSRVTPSKKAGGAGMTDRAVMMVTFTAVLHRPAGERGVWTFLVLPKRASARLPSRGMVSVRGVMNGSPFQATLQPDGAGGHWLRVERSLREAAGAVVGDRVTLEIASVPAGEEPEPDTPPDLKKALAAAPGDGGARAREAWAGITPAARRDYIQWITSGKKAATRATRIDKACDMLAKGKRRPCCFDRSGMYDKSLSCPVAAPPEFAQG